MTGSDDEVFEKFEKDALNWCERFYKDLRRSSPTKQLAVGTLGGWCSGYVSAKFGKAAATGVGLSILLLHFAQHKGYVTIDWKRFNKDVKKVKQELDKRTKKDVPKLLEKVQTFVTENILLAGGFAGGFFLGLASA